MAEKLFPYQQSIPVAFLIGKGLLTGLEGALNPQVKNEAEQLKRMYAEMGDDHKERVMAQAKGGRVLKQAVIQIYKEWQAQQARALESQAAQEGPAKPPAGTAGA